MSVTAFLSMWLSNTATTAMMFPIAQAVLGELRQSTSDIAKQSVVNNGTNFEMHQSANHNEENGCVANHNEEPKIESSESDINKSEEGIVR